MLGSLLIKQPIYLGIYMRKKSEGIVVDRNNCENQDFKEPELKRNTKK